MFTSGTARFSTGSDDLREGSVLHLRFIMSDGSIGATTDFIVQSDGDFDTNSDTTKSWTLRHGASLEVSDVFRIEIAFSPDRRDLMEDDDFSFDGLVLTVSDTDAAGVVTTVTLFSDPSINFKFEEASVWRSPQLASFDAEGLQTIVVRDDDDQRVPAAAIYLDHAFLGFSDDNGEFVTDQEIRSSSHLVVAKRIHENGFYRSNHDVDSDQNWNYRIYHTNIGIGNDGRATPFFRLGSFIRVTVRKRNTLIGVNVLFSLEWDADMAERDRMADTIRRFSKQLHNATDGQFFVEFARIASRRQWWEDCDFKVYVEDHRRGKARIKGGFLGNNIVHSFTDIARKSAHGTLTHEFGHYGLGLGDEYKGSDPNCTARLNEPEGTRDGRFRGRSSRGACLMTWNRAPKLCSDHPSNPHKRGTDQGDDSCWHTLINNYRDDERLELRDPANRRTLPGTIRWSATAPPDMVTHPLLEPRVVQQLNENLPGLIGTIDLTLLDEVGSAVAGAKVSTRDRNGTWFFQGKSNDVGAASAGGVHMADKIRFELGDRSIETTIDSTDANQTFRMPA